MSTRLYRHRTATPRSFVVQFLPLVIITQSIVLSAWAIYGMAAIIVNRADEAPPHAA